MFARLTLSQRRWLGLSAVVALALIVRLILLNQLPPGYWYDEAHKAWGAYQIWRGERLPVYFTDNQGIEAGFFWLVAGWYWLFGPSFIATRIMSALIGTASVIATWFTACELFQHHPQRHSIGLVAAGLLAALFWHVNWSRQGVETISVSLFAVLLPGLLAAAWRRKSPWLFVLAGALLGLSQYANPNTRALPLEALLVFAVLWQGSFATAVGYGLAFLGGFFPVYGPLGWFFVQQPEWFFNRVGFVSEQTRAGGTSTLLSNAVKTLLSINWRGDEMLRHNLPYRPAFDLLSSLWMFTGLAVIVREEREHWRPHLAVLLSVLVNMVISTVSDGAPGFGRTLGITGLIVIWPAWGMVWAWQQHRAARLLRPAVVASLAVIAVLNLYTYFGRYFNLPGQFDSYEIGHATLLDAARSAADSGGTGVLWLDEGRMNHPGTQLVRELTMGDLRQINAEHCLAYPATLQPGDTIAGMEFAVAPRLWELYPDARFTNVVHEPEPFRYGAVMVSGDITEANVNTVPHVTFGGQLALLDITSPRTTYAAGEAVPISLRWQALAGMETRYTVFIHLRSTETAMIGGVDFEPCDGWYPTDRWHTGEIIEYDAPALPLPADLPPGEYTLAIGVYDAETLSRLPLDQAGPEPDRAYVLTIAVQ